MNPEPRAAPPTVPAPTATAPTATAPTTGAGSGERAVPGWAVKAVRQLTAGELAEALEYLERHRPDDDVLGRALAGEFARRTAAAEFADRTAEASRTESSRTEGGRPVSGDPARRSDHGL